MQRPNPSVLSIRETRAIALVGATFCCINESALVLLPARSKGRDPQENADPLIDALAESLRHAFLEILP